ncbi:hypothetical protein [Breoghania sp. L-A4]|uniref:thermonuclease family protein n=1 Tax=Breoghania sp. L-A4 TaxID=2304600 RepID=UPI0013C30F70|nr:hypothetical protein [Breoghania sp. L-A4]
MVERLRTAMRRAATVGRDAIAPLRDRLGRRATRVYAGLIVLVIAFNVGSYLYGEQILREAKQVRMRAAVPVAAPQEHDPAASGPLARAVPPGALAPPRPPYSIVGRELSFQPPYVVTGSDTFLNRQVPVRLAFVNGIAPDDICMDRFLAKYPCGLMARAALKQAISGQDLRCRAIFYGREDIRYQCFAGEADIAAGQVRAGFAKPDSLGRARLSGAMEEARRLQSGAWNGGWRTMGRSAFQRNNVLLDKLDALATGTFGPE